MVVAEPSGPPKPQFFDHLGGFCNVEHARAPVYTIPFGYLNLTQKSNKANTLPYCSCILPPTAEAHSRPGILPITLAP